MSRYNYGTQKDQDTLKREYLSDMRRKNLSSLSNNLMMDDQKSRDLEKNLQTIKPMHEIKP